MLTLTLTRTWPLTLTLTLTLALALPLALTLNPSPSPSPDPHPHPDEVSVAGTSATRRCARTPSSSSEIRESSKVRYGRDLNSSAGREGCMVNEGKRHRTSMADLWAIECA